MKKLLAAFLPLSLALVAHAAEPSSVLATAGAPAVAPLKIRADHPRVLLTKETLAEIRKDVATEGSPRSKIAKVIVAKADKLLGDTKNRVSYTIIGPRLLTESRRNLDNVMTLAMAHLLTGEKKYADLAISEMRVAGNFKDWNPRHYLDTAEMTAALGIGYDWLFDAMTAAQRTEVRAAIVKHGLQTGEMSYKKIGEGEKFGWWTKAQHNWSQVC